MKSVEPRNAQNALASEKEGTAMPRDNYDYPGRGTKVFQEGKVHTKSRRLCLILSFVEFLPGHLQVLFYKC